MSPTRQAWRRRTGTAGSASPIRSDEASCRCLPPLGFLGLGEAPTIGQLSAIALVSAGLISLQAQSIKRRGAGRLNIPATGVGLSVAVYSVLVSYGTRIAGSWLSFTVWLVILDTAAFLLFAWA